MDEHEVNEVPYRIGFAVKYERELRNYYIDPLMDWLESSVESTRGVGDVIRLIKEAGMTADEIRASVKEAIHPRLAEIARENDINNLKETIKTFGLFFGVRVRKLFDLVPESKHYDMANRLVEGAYKNEENAEDILFKGFDELLNKEPLNQEKTLAFFRDVRKNRGLLLRRFVRSSAARYIGELNRYRQESLGITRYKWICVSDDRSRESHVANHGKVFDWSDDKPGGVNGRPGQEWNCRCSARPVFDEETAERIREMIEEESDVGE